MNVQIPSRSAKPARRLISAAHFYLAVILLTTTAQAQIAIQDGSPLTITHATGTAINQSFTVTAGAKAMIVILEEKGARLSEPATLTWNGQTLNRDVQTAYNTGVQRSLAIYYLFNPNPGTTNITGTMTGAASDTWLTAYTLIGVDTNIAPITGNVNTGTDATGVFSLTFNLTGVASNSWAAVAAQYANFPDSVTVTGTGGTGTVITDTNYNVTGVTAGYVVGLSAGTVTLTTTWVRAAGGQKANFAALVFSPTNGVSPPISAVKAFGIKFLGNTTDAVTGTAGAYPISGWNNIANATYTTGTIYSSDGTASATLTRSGSGADNTWSSGIYPDGGNFSLLYGYQDAGQNAPATNVVSGLTGSAYDVFLYTAADNARPSSGTDYLPNYTINGNTYYTATLDGRSAMWKIIQGVPGSQNANTYPTTLVAGHYIKISNVTPVGGKITITANSDNLTYRSPLNGIELVSVGNAPQVMVQPVPHRLYTGGVVNFQAQVEGANPLAYQWRQNGINLNEGGRIIGSKTNSLTITNLAVTDTGDYDVVITNSYGSVTSLVAHLDAVVMTPADAAFEAWVAAYVVTNGYQVYIANSLENRNFAFMWQQAFMIWMIEDTYDRTHSPEQKQLINDLLNTFMKQNGTTLTWDNWDDDLEWAEIALIRGYQITGNVVALNSAIYVWDAVNSRGLDDTFGGGIWEKLPPPTSKCTLSVHPQIIAGMYLYQLTGQSDYLTTCQTLYAWGRTNVFDTNSGQVNEGVAWADTNQVNSKVLTSNNSYNSGLFANAACALYEATGNTQYLADAILAVNHKINVEPISNENNVNNGYFGGEQLFRAVARIASEDNYKLWPTYGSWLQANAAAAWSDRRTDLNLTHNDFTSATPAGTNNLQALETQAAVLIQQIALDWIPGFATNFMLNYGGTPISQSAGKDWNTVNQWNPTGLSAASAVAAYPGSSFEVVVGSMVRNSAGSTYNVFPGNTLQVDGNGNTDFNSNPAGTGEVRFKNSTPGIPSTNYFYNLILNGGELNIGDPTDVVLQGQITVQTNSVFGTQGGTGTNQTYRVDSYLTGGGTIVLYLTNSTPRASLNITGTTNTFTGQWNILQGPLVGSGANSLGTNTITINTNGTVETSYPINNPNASLVLNGKVFLTQNDTFKSVYINGAGLAPGTYQLRLSSASYPSNFPATFSALYGTTATTASGQITVLSGGSPIIGANPTWKPTTIYVGQMASITISGIIGTGPFSYQWMAGPVGSGIYTDLPNGGNISGATNATLTITNAQLADYLDYVVRISNAYGVVTSTVPATLTVNDSAPFLVTDTAPNPATYYAGFTATLTATFDGSRPIFYQWVTDGGSGTFTNVPGATNSTLVIPNVQAGSTGSYCLIATNLAGGPANSSPTSLTVVPSTYAIHFGATNAITTADVVLNHPGVVTGAAVIGGTAKLVTLSNGSSLTFTANGSVATVAPGDTGAFAYPSPATTGNTNFDAVLNQCNFDTGPKTITLNNLVAGHNYSVLLIGLDTRGGLTTGSAGARLAYFQDPVVPSDVSSTFHLADAVYVMASFQAETTTQTIIEQLPTGNNGNMNALVIYDLSAVVIPPTLSLAPTGGGNLTLTWSAGSMLLQATNLLGPWTTNGAATSPYTVSPTNPQDFFRVQTP